MKRNTFLLAFALACGVLLMWGGRMIAADEPANVAGTWEMTSETPRGTFTQTLKIQQDGSSIKGTLTGRRGESAFEGTVTGNKLSFTVTRETPNGTFTLEYSATVDGDAMKGTVHSERFDREWTAKRTGEAGEK
jgi:carbon-monoxide dehydrogenase large subunit